MRRLRADSKKVRDRIENYIMELFDGSNYDVETPETFEEAAKIILDVFDTEKAPVDACAAMTRQERFIDWTAGLPCILHTCDYYLGSAVDILGDILQEPEEERARYSDSDAEKLLSYLIYRQLVRGYEKCTK